MFVVVIWLYWSPFKRTYKSFYNRQDPGPESYGSSRQASRHRHITVYNEQRLNLESSSPYLSISHLSLAFQIDKFTACQTLKL